MHQRHIHIFSIILLLLPLLFIGCQKKKEKPTSLPIENTTQVEEKISTVVPTPTPLPVRVPSISKYLPKKKELPSSDTFTLQSLENNIYTVDTKNNRCSIKESHSAITVLSFFTTWCPPCMTQLSYLDDLQKRYTKDISLISILMHDTITKSVLTDLLLQKHIFCFISYDEKNNLFADTIAKNLHLPKNFSIPLTVIYVKGKYFTHYEGIVPIEMIEYDIKEAQKLL